MTPDTRTAATKHLQAIQAGVQGIAALLAADAAEEPKPAPTPAPAPAPPKPPVQKPFYLAAAPEIVVPHERDVAAFYGEATPAGANLDWFSFPTDDIRLYSRNGDQLRDRDGDGRDDHRCHGRIKSLLENALLAIYHERGKEAYYREGWHVYSGCFNYRRKKLGGSLSMHSWGIAVDINSNDNPLHSKTTSFAPESIDIMERYGFLWGPRAWGMPGYDSDELGLYVDPMHFQVAIPYLDGKSWYAQKGLPANIKPWSAS